MYPAHLSAYPSRDLQQLRQLSLRDNHKSNILQGVHSDSLLFCCFILPLSYEVIGRKYIHFFIHGVIIYVVVLIFRSFLFYFLTGDKDMGRKTRKISSKLLTFIIPVVVLTVLALVIIAATISKNRMTEMATETLESSISNQADNIEAWLEENLEYFNTVKHTIEAQKPRESELVAFLDPYYGFNSNSPEGFYIGTSDGKFYKASESGLSADNVTGSTWYKQGLSRIRIGYGTAYKNAQGETVISATGIYNDGSDNIKVIGADVTLDKISIIVNSGVKMHGASSFLVDTNDYQILAHRDVSLIGTKLSESSSDALLAGAASSVINGDLSSKEIDGNMVAFSAVSGTDWVLVSYIPTSIILKSVTQMGILLFIVGAVAISLIILPG